MPLRVLARALALGVLVFAQPPVCAQQHGGELVFPVFAEPPSLDGHREEGADVIIQLAPFYNTLLRADPEDPTGTRPYPSLAESWTVSPDGKAYTFKIREGVRFHDGSPLSARDVEASFRKIIFPAAGSRSPRKEQYADVLAIETPNPATVIFRLRAPSSSFLARMMSPYNFIYRAALIADDPHWYEGHVVGTGPYRLAEFVPGSYLRGEKNPDYWDEGKPYLDGFRAVQIPRAAAQIAAFRAGRAHIAVAGVTPADRDALLTVLGGAIAVQESPSSCALLVAFNHDRKPFDDRRVRRAMTLALDRHAASLALSAVATVKSVSGVQVPGTPFATQPEALHALAGYATSIGKARTEARRLLEQAGAGEGFAFALTVRGVPMPYEPVGVWLIDQWRRVGLKARPKIVESDAYEETLRSGSFEVAMEWRCDDLIEPSLDLRKFLSSERSPANYARYADPVLDALFDRQEREIDVARRRQIIREFEKRLLDEEAHYLVVLQGQRIVPLVSTLKGWKTTPSATLSRTLDAVWLERKPTASRRDESGPAEAATRPRSMR